MLRAFAHIVLGTFVLAFGLGAPQAFAVDDAPRVDCSKPENKKKAACKPHLGVISDDEIVNAAYWLARDGKYAASLALLATAKNQNDARVLTATGFSTRKLGDVDAALPFYHKALELKPDYVQAREYLGEAFLTKGDRAAAVAQLGEIETRCGTGCVAFVELKRQLALYDAARSL